MRGHNQISLATGRARIVETAEQDPPPFEEEDFVGSEWVLDGQNYSGDPFEPKFDRTHRDGGAMILEYRDGWVRYRIGREGFSLFPNERMKFEEFKRIYRPLNGDMLNVIEKLKKL